MMANWKTMADIRREYGNLNLSEHDAKDSPIEQFKLWFEEVVEHEKSDPTAMILSTCDERGYPDSRVVLLKGIDDGAFIFYTNYQSSKAMQLAQMPYAALNFYWPEMARQVRIRGQVKKVSSQESDKYFASRPVKSQISAIVSNQSQELKSRVELEEAVNAMIEKYGQEPVLRPSFWGGFRVIPEEVEFWQGRDNRLHDRIQYFLQQNDWIKRRLAP